ncbi:MAG: phage major capsid protein [Beijerinckiaceae bacterium]
MKTLNELRKALADQIKALADIETKALADEATEADRKAFDDAATAIEAVEANIKRLERSERLKGIDTLPSQDRTDQPRTPAAAKKDLTKVEKLGLVMHSMIKAKNEEGRQGPRAVFEQMEKDGYGEVASEFAVAQKNMVTTTNSSGGFAVPPDFNPEIYETLSPYSAFMRGGPNVQAMPNGNYRQSAMASRPSASYRAEAARIDSSVATLRDISMSAKLLSALVPMSNQLIAYTGGRAWTAAANEMAKAIGITLDTAMIRGNGTAPNPRGLHNIVGIGSFNAAAGTAPSKAVVDAAVRPLLNAIESFPELQGSVAWMGTQRVKGYLTDLMTAGGETNAYPTMDSTSPRFKDYPFLVTGQIPNNLGAGTNESELSLVAFSQVLFGETQGLTLSISDQASYFDGTNHISSFQHELTLIKATLSHDVAIKYSEAVQILRTVQWGA